MEIDVIDFEEDSDNGPATMRVLLDSEAKHRLIEIGLISSLKHQMEVYEESLEK